MGGIRPYVVIQDWMLDLGLRPSEVIALAVIYGFTQDGEHTCHTSLDYLGRMCMLNRRSVRYMLRRLEQRGFLIRTENPGKISEYAVNLDSCTRAKIAPGKNCPGQSATETRAKIAPLSPLHPPIPDNKDNKINHERAGAPAHTHTCEGGGADGWAELYHVSSVERESVGFDGDMIAGIKRDRMAAALERVSANLAAKDGLVMSERQKARFLDHWCAHRPGSGETRAEGDPYFSLYAKARLWAVKDLEKAAEKAADGVPRGFTPPSLDEVRAFFAEAAPGIDPLEFYGYYKARGWVFPGGVRMSDWKAAVYMWVSREKDRRQGNA